jgi:transcriptional regulator with XRE-family HTH domain
MIMKVSEFVDMPARLIADVSEVRESTLSKYFNGHRDPNFSSISEMAKNLNMTPEDVIKGIRLRREKKKILSKLTSG